MPVAQIIGRSQITEVNAVISTGRNLVMAPSITDSCIFSFVISTFFISSSRGHHSPMSGNQNLVRKAFSKYKIITTHVSTAFQKSAINQTQTATEKLKPEIYKAIIPPIKLKGIESATIDTSPPSL